VQAADRKKAFFLSWAGTHIFELVKNLFGSENLGQQTYEQITEKQTEHFKQKRHTVVYKLGKEAGIMNWITCMADVLEVLNPTNAETAK